MLINEQIKELIDDAAHHIREEGFQTKVKDKGYMKPRLVYDGVVDEKYDGIVYLLKEATEAGATKLRKEIDTELKNKTKNKVNQYEEISGELIPNTNHLESWDFISTTRRKAKAQGRNTTEWQSLCFWTEALLNPETTYKNAKMCGENLLKVAIVNIKKTTGEGTSENAPIDAIINDEADESNYGLLIKKEIALINSHFKKIRIVICGGTFKWAQNLYQVKPNNVKPLDCGARYFYEPSLRTIFLEFIHPTQYGTAAKVEITYAYAQAVFAELRRREPSVKGNP